MDIDKVRVAYNENLNPSYEKERWFKNSKSRAGYDMTLQSINHHFLKHCPDNGYYLELGPGAGTWTRIILKRHPHLICDLVDLSVVMLNQAKKNLAEFSNIDYHEGNFLDFDSSKKYNVFFSSRALEYLPDKTLFAKKIRDLLANGGEGLVITKTPKYSINKFLGRRISFLHQGQIAPSDLVKILQAVGFKEMLVYPVTFSFSLLKSVLLDKLLHRLFYRCKLNFISQLFSESYMVKFKKE